MVERTGSPGRRSRSGACSGGRGRNAGWRLDVPQTAQATWGSPALGRELAGDGAGIGLDVGIAPPGAKGEASTLAPHGCRVGFGGDTSASMPRGDLFPDIAPYET